MAASKERTFYKAVRRAAAELNSAKPLKQILDTVVRRTARAMTAGVSLALLDSSRKKLIHSASWGLPRFYLYKGVLDADKSLAEVLEGEPIAIADVSNDGRIQYPELAVEAGIAAMLGVPVTIGGPASPSARRTSAPRSWPC